MKMKIVSGMLAMSMLFINADPVFAQLGDVTAPPPPPVETPPVTAPAPEPTPPPVEPTPTVNIEIVTQVVTVPSDNTGPVISGLARWFELDYCHWKYDQ